MISIIRLRLMWRRLSQGLSWPGMLFLVIAQSFLTYVLFCLAGEDALTSNPIEFIYYNMVVVSTVGFGDLSPATDLGKAIVSFYQIPSGLIIFATFISKMTQLFIDIARRNMHGNNDFSHYQQHILLLCWDKYSSAQIVALILADKKRQHRDILLCVTDEMENPFPEITEISFVKISSFSDEQELERIALKQAARIIINGKSDDETLSIALSIATNSDNNANISAHFFDKSKAKLLKTHCPQIECSLDNGAQMMVRSMQDPGSSQVADQLFSTLRGATLYCLQVPKGIKSCLFSDLFTHFKAQHQIILIALSPFKNGDNMQINPHKDVIVKSGDHLHYIADERFYAEELSWLED
ncbi:potassium channel protein [Psychromonas sp. PRT-SC03]|nr:potassium channel protein [Psychromonas sp. PRT-SC03]